MYSGNVAHYLVFALPLAGVFALDINQVSAAASDRCRAETIELQDNAMITNALDDMLQKNVNLYEENCNLSGIEGIGCDYRFSTDNQTYTDYCEDLGGQVYDDCFWLVLECDRKFSGGSASWELGTIPQCIGAFCNQSQLKITVSSMMDGSMNSQLVWGIMSAMRRWSRQL
jgi:hypothetical protein